MKDRAGGLYYMLLLNDNNKLLECGLTPALTGQGGSLPGLASLVKRNFILNPKPLYLPGKLAWRLVPGPIYLQGRVIPIWK